MSGGNRQIGLSSQEVFDFQYLQVDLQPRKTPTDAGNEKKSLIHAGFQKNLSNVGIERLSFLGVRWIIPQVSARSNKIFKGNLITSTRICK
jgi:hypothetical protein